MKQEKFLPVRYQALGATVDDLCFRGLSKEGSLSLSLFFFFLLGIVGKSRGKGAERAEAPITMLHPTIYLSPSLPPLK